MSRLYQLLETQVETLIRFILEDDHGQVHYGEFVRGPKWAKFIINVLTLFAFILIAFVFGLYLWNQGLQPAFPGIVAPIGTASPQLPNQFAQLFITLLSLMFIL